MKQSLALSLIQQKLLRPLSLAARKAGWVAFLALALTACSKKEEHPDVVRLKAQWQAAEQRLVDLELELKTAREDAAQVAQLTEEKELMKSRIERVKEMLIGLGAMERPAPGAKPGGGGH